jgi:hypothetical protein
MAIGLFTILDSLLFLCVSSFRQGKAPSKLSTFFVVVAAISAMASSVRKICWILCDINGNDKLTSHFLQATMTRIITKPDNCQVPIPQASTFLMKN